MKCDKIRLLLDEYINNTLDNKNKLLVKTHLESCKHCQSELEFLKKYFNIAKNIPEKEAPKDLLENINKKLHDETVIDKIKKIFLYPIKIKVPVEILGVLSTAIVIFILLNPFNITFGAKKEKAFEKPPLTEGPKSFSEEELAMNDIKAIDNKKMDLAKEKIASPKKNKAITINNSPQEEQYKTEGSNNSISKSKKEEPVALYNIALNIIQNNSSSSLALEKTESDSLSKSIEPKYRMKKSIDDESKTAVSKDDRALEDTEEEKGLNFNQDQNEIYNEIEKIIKDIGGKINLENSSNKTNIINIVIPEKDYEPLIIKLEELGKIETIKEAQENKPEMLELNLVLE